MIGEHSALDLILGASFAVNSILLKYSRTTLSVSANVPISALVVQSLPKISRSGPNTS